MWQNVSLYSCPVPEPFICLPETTTCYVHPSIGIFGFYKHTQTFFLLSLLPPMKANTVFAVQTVLFSLIVCRRDCPISVHTDLLHSFHQLLSIPLIQ